MICSSFYEKVSMGHSRLYHVIVDRRVLSEQEHLRLFFGFHKDAHEIMARIVRIENHSTTQDLYIIPDEYRYIILNGRYLPGFYANALVIDTIYHSFNSIRDFKDKI